MAFDSCKGVIGRWLIYETMPRYIPPSVRFRYGNNPWQVVSPANSYRITTIYDPSASYVVVISCYSKTGLCGSYYDPSYIYSIDLAWIAGDFRLEITGEGEETNPYNDNGIYSFKKWGLIDKYGIRYDNIYQIVTGCRNNPSGLWTNSPPWISQVIPMNNASINYLLEIFYDNNLVYSETKNTRPTVEVIPESCKYYDEDKRYVRDYYNYNKSSYMDLVVQGNKAWVNAYILDINREFSYPINLYYGESDCNLPPKIDTECVPECLKCPKNTCAIPCGNVICCYNNDGVSILSIPKERYCK